MSLDTFESTRDEKTLKSRSPVAEILFYETDTSKMVGNPFAALRMRDKEDMGAVLPLNRAACEGVVSLHIVIKNNVSGMAALTPKI